VPIITGSLSEVSRQSGDMPSDVSENEKMFQLTRFSRARGISYFSYFFLSQLRFSISCCQRDGDGRSCRRTR